MSDKTYLAMAGSRVAMPRVLKRIALVTGAVGSTMLVALALMLSSGLLQAKGTIFQAWAIWLAFINRPDIQATMVLTAFVTVLFVYWQRDQERGR